MQWTNHDNFPAHDDDRKPRLGHFANDGRTGDSIDRYNDPSPEHYHHSLEHYHNNHDHDHGRPINHHQQ